MMRLTDGSNGVTAKASDPIEFELFKNAIFAIADEMALTIFRTTYSGVLKDNMDYSTAFADADGRLVAQGLTLPGHLGSIPTALAVVVEQFADDIHENDILVMNDPFEGGMHLPDIFCSSRSSPKAGGSRSPPRSAITPMSVAGSPARWAWAISSASVAAHAGHVNRPCSYIRTASAKACASHGSRNTTSPSSSGCPGNSVVT